MSGPRVVVSTKLNIPAARPGHVRRQALIDLLEAEDMARLVLVAAPPGSGKTTLMAEWAVASRSQAFTWLSLDAGDDDPVQFWTGVIEALRAVRPGIGADALAALEAPGTDVRESALVPLIEALAAAGEEPLVLVVEALRFVVLTFTSPVKLVLSALVSVSGVAGKPRLAVPENEMPPLVVVRFWVTVVSLAEAAKTVQVV